LGLVAVLVFQALLLFEYELELVIEFSMRGNNVKTCHILWKTGSRQDAIPNVVERYIVEKSRSSV
jgi:hypothetical protein